MNKFYFGVVIKYKAISVLDYAPVAQALQPINKIIYFAKIEWTSIAYL